jgi:hypothetical protein
MAAQGIGSLGFKAITASYDPDLTIHRPWNTPFGLTEQVTYLYGGWREADGTLHVFERKFIGPMTAGLWLMKIQDGAVEINEVSIETVRGEVKRTYGEDEYVLQGQMMEKVGKGGLTYKFALRAGEFTWTEGDDVLALDGKLVGPGIQIYAPDADEPILYISELYKVTGTVTGQEVEGFVFLDHAYWAAGYDWKEYRVFKDLQLGWQAFANEYEDGSVEWGHLCLGRHGFNFTGVGSADGAVSCDSTITSGLDLGEEDWCTRQTWRDSAGKRWIFELEAPLTAFTKARWGGYCAQAGHTHRVGDPRKVKVGFSWLETFGDRIREDKIKSFDEAMAEG